MKIKTIFAKILAVSGLALSGLMPSHGLADAASPALETKQMSVTDLFPFLDKYYALPPRERDRFHLVYAVSGDGIGAMRAVLKRSGGDVPITISPAGVMAPLPTLEDVAARTMVSASAPKDTKIRMVVKLAASLAPAQVLDAKALKASLEQASQSSKKAAGLMAIALPTFQHVCFPGAASGNAILGDGKPLPLKMVKAPGNAGSLLCFAPVEQPTAVRVSLDQMPSDLLIMK